MGRFSVKRSGRYALAGLVVCGLLAVASPAQATKQPPHPQVLLQISPRFENFGTVFVFATSTPAEFTVQNVGNATSGPLLAFSITRNDRFAVNPPEVFTIVQDTCTGTSLAPRATCSVSVVFNPKQPIFYTGDLDVGQPPDANTMRIADFVGRGIALHD
jgi:hypothetical protein